MGFSWRSSGRVASMYDAQSVRRCDWLLSDAACVLFALRFLMAADPFSAAVSLISTRISLK